MQRVLSFPNTGRFDDSGGLVTKRICCSSIFSVGFLCIVLGFLLGRFAFDQELILTRRQMKNSSGADTKTSSTTSLLTDLVNQRSNLSVFPQRLSLENFEHHFRSLTIRTESERANSSFIRASRLHSFLQSLGFEMVTSLSPTLVELAFPDPKLPNEVVIINGAGSIVGNFKDTKCEPVDVEVTSDQWAKSWNTIQGEPIYVNFGRDEDYLYLDSVGINVAGHIILARIGGSSVEEVVMTGLNHDALGVILFIDPAEQALLLPDLFTPKLLAYLQTQYAASLMGATERNSSVPVILISETDAQSILQYMGAKELSPTNWRGRLNCSYPLGPGFSDSDWSMELTVNTAHVVEPYYDVIAVIPGSHEPDRVVILESVVVDCHDDLAAAAVLKEIASQFSLYKSEGWQPYRSLAFAFWGQIDEVRRPNNLEIVAYLTLVPVEHNGLKAEGGEESVVGSLLLSSLLQEVVNEFNSTETLQYLLPPGPPSSRHTSGIPFVQAPIYGRDVSYAGARKLGAIWVSLAMQLSSNAVLPFALQPYLSFFNHSIAVLNQRFNVVARRHKLFLETLTETVATLTSAIEMFEERWEESRHDALALRRLSDQLAGFSRALACPRGTEQSHILLTRHPLFSSSNTAAPEDKTSGLGELNDLLRAMTSTAAPTDLQRQIVTLVSDVMKCLNNATDSLSHRLDRILMGNT